MFPAFRSNSTRCALIGCGLLAGSLALQGLSNLIWAEPARTRSLVEFIYSARGALLQALHVMALALLTTGVLRARLAGAAAICAAWALAASLIELAQHPEVVNRLLKWTESRDAQPTPLDPAMFDWTLGLLWNSKFSWTELAASIAGGGAALEVVRHYSKAPAETGARP